MRSHTVITSFWLKPIPFRFYDWEATLDNYDAGDPIGFGATEADAIADLNEQIEENEPVQMCPMGQCPWSGCTCEHRTDEERVMPMLPNDHHPGPRCSCADCLKNFPECAP